MATNPGSQSAISAGCICPRLDNGHGSVSLARDRGGWVIFTDCPLHGIGGSAPAEIPAQGDHQVALASPRLQPTPAQVEQARARHREQRMVRGPEPRTQETPEEGTDG